MDQAGPSPTLWSCCLKAVDGGSGGSGSQSVGGDGGAGIGGDGRWWPVASGAGLGWWPVAEAEEMTAVEAASAMAEAAAVTEETAAAAAAARRSRHDGVAGPAAAPPPKTCSPNSCDSSADSLQGSAAKSCFEINYFRVMRRQVMLRNYFLLLRLETDLTNLPPQNGRKGRSVPILGAT